MSIPMAASGPGRERDGTFDLCEKTEEIVERTQVMDKIEKSEAIVDERETTPTRLSPPQRKAPLLARARLRV
jgi:hypothetical protein